jgi:hypothetical protein
LVLNPRDDVEKYSRAPLSSGQSVKVRDLVVLAGEVSKERASFRVLTNVDYQAIQEAEAKAAAELKAKQEVEAKAAAELKAKQEAEAKSAATKRITITCVKGKITKKVIGVKPKCPRGYKKK